MRVALLICAGALALPVVARAQVDAVESRLLAELSPLLRWDNIEGGPTIVAGPNPQRVPGGLHAVRLEAGREMMLELPAGTMLRIRRPEGLIAPTDVNGFHTSGSGMLAGMDWQASVDGRDLLWRAHGNGPSTILLARPAGSAPLDVALFVSRSTYPSGLVPYRDQIAFGSGSATVAGFGETERYDLLDRPVTLRVSGPKRIEVSTRLLYPSPDDDPQQTYRIEALLDGRFYRALEFETMPVTSSMMSLDGRPALLGRSRAGFLDIPAGTYQLTLRPSRPLLARAAADDRNAYLLPSLNAPQGLAQSRNEGDPRAPTLWAVPPEAALAGLEPALLEQAIRRVARGNDRQPGGLAAAARLAELAREHPADRALDQEADALRGSHTFFRDVLPIAVSEGAQRRVTLPAPDGRRGSEGYTLPVPRAPDAFIYPLPPLEAPSELRLFAERAGVTAPADLFVQLDDAPPRRLRVMPGDAAGALATLTLPLPARTRLVRLWRTQDSPELRMGAQYRAARPPRLSDNAYGAELDLLGRSVAKALFVAGLRDALDCPAWLGDPSACPAWHRAGSIAATELLNDWIPLFRLLRSRHRALFGAVTPVVVAPERIEALRAAGENRLADRLLRARALAMTGSERAAALAALVEVYTPTGDVDALLGLRAAELGDGGGDFEALARLLRVDGQDAYADQIALLANAMSAAGPLLAESAEPFVVEHAGAAWLVARERALGFRAFLASPDRPVRIAVSAGGRLKLELRPLIGADKPATQVRVTASGATQTFSVAGASPSSGLDLTGLSARAGTSTVARLDLAAAGDVTVLPTGGPVLVTAEIDRVGSTVGSPMRSRLAGLFAAFDADPASATGRAALAEAAALANSAPEDREVQAQWSGFERRSRWRRLTAVDFSAGVRSLEVAGQSIESPSLRARASLVAPLAPGERFLPANGGGLALFLENVRPATVRARLVLDPLPSYRPSPAIVSYRIDDGPVQLVALTSGGEGTELVLPVPPGDHVVRFALAEPLENGYVRLHLSEPGQVIGERRDRSYDVATAAQPLIVTVAGPAWLRVDELRDGRTISSYRQVDSSIERLNLRPAAGQGEALFRLFELTPDEAESPAPEPLPFIPVLPVLTPVLTVADAKLAESVRFVDVLPLGRQEDGTTSLGISGQRRTPTTEEEDGGRRERVDQFVEARIAHRHFAPDARLWSRAELLGRVRERGGPTLGARGRLDLSPAVSPLDFSVGGAAFAQVVGGDRIEWSANADAQIAWRGQIGPRTAQTFEFGAFSRHLSLDAGDAAGLPNLDLDVFNRYRSDHRYGINATWRLGHTPWLDTRWRLHAAAVSNEDLSLDRASLTAEWEQLAGDVVLRASYRRTRFFADEDRSGSRWGDTIRLAADWDRFRDGGQRIEVGTRAVYRLDRRDLAATLLLTWHFGPGRGYRDFAPGEVDFESLRARRLFDLPTNEIIDVP